MKPSFAYANRILERLPEVAHHHAEREMQGDGVRALEFVSRNAGVRHLRPRAPRSPRESQPDYERVANVKYEVEGARLFSFNGGIIPQGPRFQWGDSQSMPFQQISCHNLTIRSDGGIIQKLPPQAKFIRYPAISICWGDNIKSPQLHMHAP